jgi:hypothetical protein
VTKKWQLVLFGCLIIDLLRVDSNVWFDGLGWVGFGVLGKPIIIHLYKIK